MVTRRAGHSLVELIVAVTFLGTSFGGLAATALLGARWTLRASAQEHALAAAAATLDSLLGMTAPPGPGSIDRDGLRLEWTTGPASSGTLVTVRASRAALHVSEKLEGTWMPLPPALVLP